MDQIIPMLIPGELLGNLPLRVFNFRQANDIRHRHHFHELVIVRRGSGIHVTDHGDYPIGHGDVFLILPGSTHTYREVNSLEIANVLYQPERLSLQLDDLPETVGYRRFFLPPPSNTPASRRNHQHLSDPELREAETLLNRLLLEQNDRKPGQLFLSKLLFQELIALICRSFDRMPPKSTDEYGRLAQVVDFMQRNHAEPLTVSRLAALGGRSPSTLNRMFQATLGCSPIEFLIDLRLQKGAELLRQTDAKISEIALRTGFCDSNYFTKLFTRKYGCTPRQYRCQA